MAGKYNPADLNEVSDRLSDLSDALYKKQKHVGLSAADERDWGGIVDYWDHVERLQNGKGPDSLPERDPLTLLKVAAKFNLAAPEQLEKRRKDFTDQAAAIVGHDLTPAQLRKLYKLMTGFNPAQPR